MQYGGAYSFGGLIDRCLIPLPFLLGGVFFPGLVPPDPMDNSTSEVGIKPGDSHMMIQYQVDQFSHFWLVEYLVAQSQIKPRFISKVSCLTHFPLDLGCEDYTFYTMLMNLRMVMIPSSQIPSKHLNGIDPLMNLILLLLYSLQVYHAW